MQQNFTKGDYEDEQVGHETLRFALDSAGIGAWDFDLLSNEVSWDVRCRQLFGFSAGEPVSYDQVFRHARPEDALTIHQTLQKVLDPSARTGLELRFCIHEPGGCPRWVLLKGRAYFTSEGIASRLAGIAQDISADIHAAEQASTDGDMTEAAINNSIVGLFRIDMATNQINYSPAFATILTGEPTPNLTREDFVSHIHPDDAASRLTAYAAAALSGDLHYESRTIWNDGSIHWIRTVGSYSFDDAGTPLVFSGTVQDITAEKKAQQDANAVQQLADLAIRSSGIGVFRFDLTNDNTEYSPAFAAIFTGGAGKANFSRKDFINRLHPDDEPLRIATIKKALQTGEIHYEPRVIWDDGSVHRIRVTGACIFDGSGKPTAFSGTAKDITELALQQEALKAAEEQLAQTQLKNEARFRSIVEQAPMAIGLLRGRDMVIELGNEKIFEIWGKDRSIIGKRLIDALPEIEGQGFMELLKEVYETGEPFFGNAILAKLVRRGRLEDAYFDFTYTPLRDSDGTVTGVMAMAMEVTEQIQAFRAVEESEARFRSLIEEAPFATALYVGRELVIETANEAMIDLWGKGASVIGRPLAEALPELNSQPFLKILDDVFTSGTPYHAQEAKVNLVVNGAPGSFYFNFTYKPIRDKNNEVYGIINMAVDVTAQVLARDAIKASEARFRSLVEEAPVATCLFTGREMRIEVANSAMIGYWGKGDSVIGKPFLEAVPELEGQPFLDILDEVFRTGKTYEAQAAPATLEIDGVMGVYYFDFTYKPLLNAEGEVYGIMDMAVDVTERVLASRKLEEGELFARNIIDNSPIPTLVLLGDDLVVHTINQNMLELLGRTPAIIGVPFGEAIPEFVKTLARLRHIYATGETYYQAEEKVDLYRQGQLQPGYYNYIFKALRNTAGEIYGIIATATDITDQVLARQQVEEAETALRGAIELAALGTWSCDISTNTFSFSERLQSWFGFREGETVYNTGYNPIHEKDRDRVRAAIAKALNPDYGGFYDVEYTIVDYRTGQERICHAQGKTIFDDKGNPVKLNGTTQDVTEQRQVQLTLEQLVRKRTEELTAANEELAETNAQLLYSNEELAQYAYVASHDLQEPLRKIRMFSGMLESKQGLPEDSRRLVDKIARSSERMSLLITDLLEFSKLLKSDALVRPVNLEEVVTAVVGDFELMVTEKQASVTIEQLPVIEAIGLQMNQLFYNLISNALKFNKPGTAPVVKVNAEAISLEEAARHIPKPSPLATYHHITIADNGIGFDVRYAEQIFEVFKRLHGRDMYPGSGIGLALCRRIVDNHDGSLYAVSAPGEGTTFHLILPDKQEHDSALPGRLSWASD